MKWANLVRLLAEAKNNYLLLHPQVTRTIQARKLVDEPIWAVAGRQKVFMYSWFDDAFSGPRLAPRPILR